MVNVFGARRTILQQLRESGTVVSGQVMAAETGLSRVAVWKHIQALREAGYSIEGEGSGYRLLEDADTLRPWEMEESGWHVAYAEETDSTMDMVPFGKGRVPASSSTGEDTGTACGDTGTERDDASSKLIVVSERQRSGRGRFGRRWHSVPGGISVTLRFHPQIPAVLGSAILPAVGLAVSQAILRIYNVRARPKWPNDILIMTQNSERKIGGILVELMADQDIVKEAAVGIGLNITSGPDLPGTAGLNEISGRDVARREILLGILHHMEEAGITGGKIDFRSLPAEWNSHSATAGRRVTVTRCLPVSEGGLCRDGSAGERISGTALGIEPFGGLMIHRDDGKRITVYSGDCLHIDHTGER